MTPAARRPLPPDGPSSIELWASLALAIVGSLLVAALLSTC